MDQSILDNSLTSDFCVITGCHSRIADNIHGLYSVQIVAQNPPINIDPFLKDFIRNSREINSEIS